MHAMFFREKILATLGLMAVLTAWSFGASQAQATWVRHSQPGDLFYNHYVPSVGENSVGAKLYPSPRPTPAKVGHTYITYPPLSPHEFLYPHHRVYKTWHADAPKTRTSVRYRASLAPRVPAWLSLWPMH